ncbi:flagellar biosynthesis anti-sigma factor FlgM, partial [Vibrio breoganii]
MTVQVPIFEEKGLTMAGIDNIRSGQTLTTTN